VWLSLKDGQIIGGRYHPDRLAKGQNRSNDPSAKMQRYSSSAPEPVTMFPCPAVPKTAGQRIA
jgi:hypothetical protein